MILDTRTLFIITPLLFFVMGVCLLVAARKEYPLAAQKSMRLWGIKRLKNLAFSLQKFGRVWYATP